MIFTFTTVFYRFGGDFVSERPPRDRRYNPHSGQIKDHKCMLLLCYFLFDGVQRHFQQYFSYIVVVNFYYDLRIKPLFGSSLPPVVCRGVHVLFTLFVFVCIQWCPTHIVLCFCFVFLRGVYPKMSVSLDGPFLFAPSIFSNVDVTHFTFISRIRDVYFM